MVFHAETTEMSSPSWKTYEPRTEYLLPAPGGLEQLFLARSRRVAHNAVAVAVLVVGPSEIVFHAQQVADLVAQSLGSVLGGDSTGSLT